MYAEDDSEPRAGPSSYHDPSPTMSSTVKELDIEIEVELYISKATTITRKLVPPGPRKKSEKRDSLRNMPSSSDLNHGQRKVKEKSSWLGLSRGSVGMDHWRPGKCKLSEEANGNYLRVYIDHTQLYTSIALHALRHTDIQRVHRSLFDRKDCLGIFATKAQLQISPTPGPDAEPLYLQFPDTDALSLWLALLRSYAMPEIYGGGMSPDGGLYRMWRQVELTCHQGRNLGVTRPMVGEDPTIGDPDENNDMDVYCLIMLNGVLSGRTTVKKGVGSPDWHEGFTFTDLPPFGTLEIMVWREKRLAKPILIGTISIPVGNFPRGQHVEGYFPVLSAQHPNGMMAGDIRLKIRVDEELILPHDAYTTVLQAMKTKNYLDWISELDSKLGIKSISADVVAVSLANDSLVNDIKELANREVQRSESSHTTLFRGNTVLTKTMEIFMATRGSAFLEASVGPVIHRLCSEKVAIDVDGARTGRSAKYIERNIDLLVHWCQEFWKSISEARDSCPEDMRTIFAYIRGLVETRYNVSEDRLPDLPWQGVSAFVFLRFFVPAILHPHYYGFWPGLTDEPVQRSLTLIAKVLQSLANLNTREDHSRVKEYQRVKDFLTSSSKAMIDYINTISTASSDGAPRSPSTALSRHQRMWVQNTLLRRRHSLSVLYREAIPSQHELLDIGKHMAIITSTVVRHTRRNLPSRLGAPSEQEFDYFCQTCLEVEEAALARVSKLAARARHRSSATAVSSPTFARSPISSTDSPVRPRRASSSERHRLAHSASSRSNMAPSDSDFLRGEQSYSETSMQSSPAESSAHIPRVTSHESLRNIRHSSKSSVDTSTDDPHLPRPSRPLLLHHARSTSTDSALSQKSRRQAPASPTVTSTVTCMPFGDNDDVAGRKKGKLWRGMLRKS